MHGDMQKLLVCFLSSTLQYKCSQTKLYRNVFYSLFLKPLWYVAMRDKISCKRYLTLTTYFYIYHGTFF